MSAAEKIPWPDVMDTKTAAQYLDVHPVTLRDWKRRGEGPPGRKMQGRWRFLRATLDAYLTGTKPQWHAPHTDLPRAERKASSGSASPRQTDARYLEALGLPTAPSQRNGRPSSTPSTTGSRD